MPPARSRPRPPAAGSRLALLLVLGMPAWAGCCLFVRPPAARELLEVGFRSPEQAFRSFQVGWRADEPDLELRCLARAFRERERISRLTYREFRARLMADEPFLRLGIADAAAAGPAEVRGDRARLVVESHGRRLSVEFVREDGVETWAGTECVHFESTAFDAHTQTEALPAGGTRLWAHVELPEGVDAGRVTELRLAREWKIDGFELLDPR